MSEIERLLKQSITHLRNDRAVAVHCLNEQERPRVLQQVQEVEQIRKEQLRLERALKQVTAA